MTRQCGGCTLCCKLVPVAELGKPGGQRCVHQRTGKGCAIYARRPLACRMYACAWLEDPTAERLSRPDHAGYVVDMMPDFVRIRNDETGLVEREIPVVQVWLDPRRPHDWEKGWMKDGHPLREYLEQRGREGYAAIMRLSSTIGFVIFPPAITGAGWQKSGQPQMGAEEHRLEQVLDVMAKAGVDFVVNGDQGSEAWAQAKLSKL